MDLKLQSRAPKNDLGWHHTETAVGDGRINLLIKSPQNGGNTRPAIPRLGSCPSHYYSSGNYCVGSDANAPHAMPRSGSCPSGYYSSGNYCVASR